MTKDIRKWMNLVEAKAQMGPEEVLIGLKERNPTSIEFAQSVGMPPAVISQYGDLAQAVEQGDVPRKIHSALSNVEDEIIDFLTQKMSQVSKGLSKEISRRDLFRGAGNLAQILSTLSTASKLMQALPKMEPKVKKLWGKGPDGKKYFYPEGGKFGVRTLPDYWDEAINVIITDGNTVRVIGVAVERGETITFDDESTQKDLQRHVDDFDYDFQDDPEYWQDKIIWKNDEQTGKWDDIHKGSLDEGPVGWAANKLAKAGGRVAQKATWGATSQKISQNVNIRSGAEDLIKIWNTSFGGRGMKRTPANIIRFLATDKSMNLSKDQLKTAWNKTSQLTRNFGTYDEVRNQLLKQRAGVQPGERREPQPEAVEEEVKIPATQQMSTDNLRNLLINAIHVKNTSDAEKELGDFPDDEEKKQTTDPNISKKQTTDPNIPDEQQPMAAPEEPVGPTVGEPTVGEPTVGEPTVGEPTVGEPTVGEPTAPDQPKASPTVKQMKQAGAQDMDNDGDYDWDDIAKTAVAQGKGEEALSSIMKAIDPEKAALVKAVLKGQVR